jgi:hypothetical protein
MAKTCIKLADELGAGAYPVTLGQHGRDRFKVTYGRSVRDELDYAAAAKALGESIMHALACSERLDNRERGGRERWE